MQQHYHRIPITLRNIWFFLLNTPLLCLSLLSQTTIAQKANVIQWADLLPDSDKAAYEAEKRRLIDIPTLPDLGALSPETNNSWLDRKPIGSHQPVQKHSNKQVEIIGYPIPYTPAGGKKQAGLSFLLVPELGAGLYLPPPPPNQTVRINLPIKLAEQKTTPPPADKPVRIIGLLKHSQQNETPYAYTIEATAWEW